MDHDRLDTFARTIASAGSRRNLLGLLATAPIVGGLLTTLGQEDAPAKDRRHRRKQRHERRKGPGSRKGDKRKRKGKGKDKGDGTADCQPDATARTCAGECGPVMNNCQQTVECGPCCDPPCGPCQRCSSERTCEPCEACCLDVCCARDSDICHADSGECCVPRDDAQTCSEQCGEAINNCGVIVDCGTCPGDPPGAACTALRRNDLYTYGPRADCEGELVCDCGQIVYYPQGRIVECKRSGVCRPNHAPVAFDVDVKHPWKLDVPIILNGYTTDDEDYLTFRIVTFPQYGYLLWGNEVFAGEPAGTPALPAPPLPAGTPMDCFPRCWGQRDCFAANTCPDCSFSICPEGKYFEEVVQYIPFSYTFTGTDTFTFAAVDLFGSEGPPALATLTIFEI